MYFARGVPMFSDVVWYIASLVSCIAKNSCTSPLVHFGPHLLPNACGIGFLKRCVSLVWGLLPFVFH